MIKLTGIGHVLLRVVDREASKRFYRDVLGFRIAEEEPEHGGVFITSGESFHTLDIGQHPNPKMLHAHSGTKSGSPALPFGSGALRHCARPMFTSSKTARHNVRATRSRFHRRRSHRTGYSADDRTANRVMA